MSHYDLANEFPEETTVEDWKRFLMDSEVVDWIRSEISMLQESELKKLVKDVSKSRSVGQAQLMNTLAKLNETKEERTGPVFIYSYVPLNKNEKQADNTNELEKDVFIDET